MRSIFTNPWKYWKPVFAIILCIATLAYITKRHTLHTIESPNGKYKVEFSQERSFRLLERFVLLNVFTEDMQIVAEKKIFRGGPLAGDFDGYYTYKNWIKPNILSVSDEAPDLGSLKVNNFGSESLKYLLIQTGRKKFFAFDIEPNSSVDLPIGYSWVLSVQIETQSGRKMEKEFLLKSKDKSNHKLVMSLDDHDILISTTDYAVEPKECCSVWK